MKVSNIDFGGFYESIHSSVIEDRIESMEIDYEKVDFNKTNLSYIKGLLSQVRGLTYKNLSIESPMFYNFCTDTLTLEVPDDILEKFDFDSNDIGIEADFPAPSVEILIDYIKEVVRQTNLYTFMRLSLPDEKELVTWETLKTKYKQARDSGRCLLLSFEKEVQTHAFTVEVRIRTNEIDYSKASAAIQRGIYIQLDSRGVASPDMVSVMQTKSPKVI